MIIILHTKQNPWITYLLVNPNLNTQSCIKGFLVVWDLYFLAVLAARPVHKKKLGPIMSNFCGRFFHVFEVKKFFLIFLKTLCPH